MLRLNLSLVALLLITAAGAQQPTVPPVQHETALVDQPLTIAEAAKWEREVALPQMETGMAPVLFVRARVPAGGGCNFIMRILINGRPLTENVFEPRLLNKLPFFDPPGTDYHFTWSRGSYADYTANAWMTMFAPNAQSNWAGTGRDTDYLFALPGLAPGQTFTLGVEHTFKGLAAAMKVEQAPLIVERVTVGGLKTTDIAAIREEIRQRMKIAPIPVNPVLPPDAGPGTRAYEVVWSGRPEPPAQVTFDNLQGWTARRIGETEATISASTTQRIWRPRVAEVFIPKNEGKSLVLQLRPPQPITVKDTFDAANLFVYGHRHFMSPEHVPIQVTALLQDARGSDLTMDLGPIQMGYWVLLHGVLPGKQAEYAFPMKFTGLQLSLPQSKGDYRLYLESLTFYQQNRKPKVYPRPSKPAFPQNANGLLPTPPPGVKTRIEATKDGARFVSLARGKTLEVTVTPAKGCLDGVSARWGDGKTFQPCAGGGIGDDKAVFSGKLLSQQVRNGALVADWQDDAGRKWQATYLLSGVSLLVDLKCPGGQATGTRFGDVAGLPNPKGIEVPYLTFSYQQPGALIAAADGIFVSVLPDLYNSDYSSMDTATKEPTADRIGLIASTVYTPLTNGRRNDLSDRLIITISPEFADTLPNHQNPPSPNRERLAPYMFVMDRAKSLPRWETMKRYGLDHVIANDFAGIFIKDYSEGFGGRWRPHPDYTIKEVQGWRQQIKDLGFMFGAYIDVTDYYPLNEWWDENNVSLTTTGDLCDAWWGSYAPKTSFMRPFTELTGRKMKEYYPPDCVYLDVSTNRGPRAMDFEAGVPGAGMARGMVIGNGDSLVEARKWYGSTVSEGIFRWMYAGVCDMDYAQVRMKQPMPVPLDFDLLKLHPFQHGTMMGYGPSCLLNAEEMKQLHSSDQPGSQAYYRYVSTSLAFGHMLLLGYGYFPPMQDMIQYYALMQGIQKEYLTDAATQIEYHNEEKFLATSPALQEGAHLQGRVRVKYSRGLTVTANLNPEKPWEVTQDGQTYTLPPYGWVISKPGEILGYSALVDGKRVDYVQCPEYTYLNSDDQPRQRGAIEVQGAAWLKKRPEGFELVPCGRLGYWQPDLTIGQIPDNRGCPVLIIDTGKLGLPTATITALGDKGQTAKPQTERLPDGRTKLTVTRDTVSFLIRR
ncbi:MAG: hypothetical protein ABFE08_23000 [Armatimonadia bacterium]